MKTHKLFAIAISVMLVLVVIAGCTTAETTTTELTTTPAPTTPPVETTTPVETTPPVETTTPAETTAPAETTTPAETTPPAETPMDDIVDTAIADGRFTTLVAALEAADLVDTLKGEGPFTVFAPTDEAFEMLPEGMLEALLEDIPVLTDVLLYHVVSGKVMAAEVLTMESADTLSGKPLTITIIDDMVMVNDAEVIITDIETANGVIHVIDTVLVPEE